MFRNRLYYSVKPFLPQPVRFAVRRWFAQRKLDSVRNAWPILPGSERPPEGWQGWPGGKKFAVVLTHDVEGPEGLAKCRRLLELEMKLGFRSCFNFIPEGPYRVSPEFRAELKANGFEVGVHDLYHDGKLFLDKRNFAKNAQRINHYLKEWDAVGFRSGFMLRDQNLLHQLDIQYDTSTFDTDPFEPQPDGAGTIFPFWVPRPGGNGSSQPFNASTPQPLNRSSQPFNASTPQPLNPSTSQRLNDSPSQRTGTVSPQPFNVSTIQRLNGYLELPYTLPQDSTLFFVLRERHPDIWIQKLDWIAKHGGMALVNVHPDYLSFDNDQATASTFSSELYERLLKYIGERYAGEFWNATPAQVARHHGQHMDSRLHTETMMPQTARCSGSSKRPKIWIDLDNTPHVPFFEPIIDELHARGFQTLVTARDAFQVCDLADKKKLTYTKVGKHYGKHRLMKAYGLAWRALQLAPTVLREKPAIGVSHGARSQLILGNLIRLPTILIEDYEYCQFPPMMRPTWLMAPEVIPDSALCLRNGHLRKYPGIKEDVYAWKLTPDPAVLVEHGIAPSQILATVRPPATEAHYHNPEAEVLFETFMERACSTPNVRVVLLPRNKKQADAITSKSPHWFQNNRTIIPAKALDGMNLIWHSDLVVSGGGTMNREAAALGVPVYSIFRGTIGAVDRHLKSQGRLVLVESVADANGKITLMKRARKPLADVTSRQTLQSIVNTIQQIAESRVVRPRTSVV